MHKPCSLEMGGKNAMIVLDDADLDLALDGVLWGAFGTTGQRCTATSRLSCRRGVHDEFLDKLVERAKALKLGDGREETTSTMGPLINESSSKRSSDYVDIGKSEGAKLLCGGKRADGTRLRERLLLRADDLRRVQAGCASSRKRSSARCFR